MGMITSSHLKHTRTADQAIQSAIGLWMAHIALNVSLWLENTLGHSQSDVPIALQHLVKILRQLCAHQWCLVMTRDVVS